MADVIDTGAEQPVVPQATPNPEGQPEKPVEKTFTQADVDRIVKDRLARENKIAPKGSPAPSKDDSKTNEQDAMATQIKHLQSAMLSSELTAQLLLSGVDATKVNRIQNLVDKSNCVNEAGLPDNAKIKAEVDNLIKDFPELVKKAEETQAGFKFGADLGTEKLDPKQGDAIAEIFGNAK